MTPIGCAASLFFSAGKYPRPPPRRELHSELGALVQRGDLQIGIKDLRIGVGLDVARPHDAGAVHVHLERAAPVPVDLQPEFLEVEDDVGDILGHAGNG